MQTGCRDRAVHGEITIISIRIDRCERMERRARDVKVIKAELCWEDDRRLDAVRLGALLPKSPAEVVEGLRRTPQGCEWLMSRWAMLAHTADVKGSWTPDQTRVAFDLLGTPAEFREGIKPGASLDLDGRVVEPADDPAAVARREIAVLKARREVVEGLDEVNHALAVADLNDEDDPELKRLRRYESTLHRRLRWCLAQLRYESPHLRANPHVSRPRWDQKPEPVAEAAPAPTTEVLKEARQVQPENPPIVLEADQMPAIGGVVNRPGVFASRLEKKLKQGRRPPRVRSPEARTAPSLTTRDLGVISSVFLNPGSPRNHRCGDGARREIADDPSRHVPSGPRAERTGHITTDRGDSTHPRNEATRTTERSH